MTKLKNLKCEKTKKNLNLPNIKTQNKKKKTKIKCNKNKKINTKKNSNMTNKKKCDKTKKIIANLICRTSPATPSLLKHAI